MSLHIARRLQLAARLFIASICFKLQMSLNIHFNYADKRECNES